MGCVGWDQEADSTGTGKVNTIELSTVPRSSVIAVVVVVYTLKTVLTSIQYLLFLTLQGNETNLRRHKLTQNKAQKNKKRKAQRKSQHLRKNM